MKTLILSLTIILSGLFAHAEENEAEFSTYLTKQFGEVTTEASENLLNSYTLSFCQYAPQALASTFKQNVIYPDACMAKPTKIDQGVKAEIRIKNNIQTFVLRNVKTAYGGRSITLLATLTPHEAGGVSYFSNLRQIGLDGE